MKASTDKAPAIETASQWQLIRRRFLKHKLAVAAMCLLMVLYALASFAEIFAPYPAQWKDLRYAYCPPQTPQFSFSRGIHVRRVKQQVDPVTFQKAG